MLADTHCHLNFKVFKNDYKEVIKRAFENGIEGIVNVGSEYSTSLRAIEIAEEFAEGVTLGKVLAAVGLHPLHLQKKSIEYADDYELESYEIKTLGEEFDYEKY